MKWSNNQEIIFVFTFFYHNKLAIVSLRILSRKISNAVLSLLWSSLFIKMMALMHQIRLLYSNGKDVFSWLTISLEIRLYMHLARQ